MCFCDDIWQMALLWQAVDPGDAILDSCVCFDSCRLLMLLLLTFKRHILESLDRQVGFRLFPRHRSQFLLFIQVAFPSVLCFSSSDMRRGSIISCGANIPCLVHRVFLICIQFLLNELHHQLGWWKLKTAQLKQVKEITDDEDDSWGKKFNDRLSFCEDVVQRRCFPCPPPAHKKDCWRVCSAFCRKMDHRQSHLPHRVHSVSSTSSAVSPFSFSSAFSLGLSRYGGIPRYTARYERYRGIKIFCTVKWYLLTDLTLRLRGLTEGCYHCYEWRSAWHTMSMKTETNHNQARIQDLDRRNKPSIFHTSEFHFESSSFEGSIHSSNPIDWSDSSEAADWAEAE